MHELKERIAKIIRDKKTTGQERFLRASNPSNGALSEVHGYGTNCCVMH